MTQPFVLVYVKKRNTVTKQRYVSFFPKIGCWKGGDVLRNQLLVEEKDSSKQILPAP